MIGSLQKLCRVHACMSIMSFLAYSVYAMRPLGITSLLPPQKKTVMPSEANAFYSELLGFISAEPCRQEAYSRNAL